MLGDDDDATREDFIEYSFFEEFGFDNSKNFDIFESILEDDDEEWDEDEDVDYKSYRDLWKVKAPEFQNEFDVFGIKFWFSVEGKYLGKTSIGNITSIVGLWNDKY